jgi:hypothetical protein
LTLPFRTALVFLMVLADPVDTVGEDAAPATPAATANAASVASAKLIFRLMGTSSRLLFRA